MADKNMADKKKGSGLSTKPLVVQKTDVQREAQPWTVDESSLDGEKKSKGPSMKTSHVTDGSTVNQQPPDTTSTAGDKPGEAKGNGMSTKGAKGPRG
uniref:Predicted protein n=1 Tax=Hordeum vulgare subsp. vulgare TaxID=112509 RepID=F2DGE4_HORVV|nr:predicted protein [Hordeum vulgare subsp. vulgare]